MTPADPYEDRLPTVDDAEAARLLATSREYTLVTLRTGPAWERYPDRSALVRRHGIRNMRLRAAGLLRVVARVADDSDIAGIGLFALDEPEARRVVEHDPAVVVGLFVAEYHPVLGFPEDGLADPA